MREGFLPDRAHPFVAVFPLTWCPDKPVPSLWAGTKIAQFKQRRVTAFRCDQGGYLELYAQ
jgi:hypothetical protein